MIKELIHDPIFLGVKSEVATKEDLIRICVIMLALLVICVTILSLMVIRQKIDRAVKMGEE